MRDYNDVYLLIKNGYTVDEMVKMSKEIFDLHVYKIKEIKEIWQLEHME
jgi:hypothetical protein